MSIAFHLVRFLACFGSHIFQARLATFCRVLYPATWLRSWSSRCLFRSMTRDGARRSRIQSVDRIQSQRDELLPLIPQKHCLSIHLAAIELNFYAYYVRVSSIMQTDESTSPKDLVYRSTPPVRAQAAPSPSIVGDYSSLYDDDGRRRR